MFGRRACIQNLYVIFFCPFTRTDDLEFQKDIISAIFKNLNTDSPLIIYHLDSKEDTVNINIKEISSLLNLKFRVISKFHPKIFRLIPNLNLVSLLCSIVEFLTNKTYGKTIIILKEYN